MNHLLFGPRWMRLANHWIAAIVAGLAATVATIIGAVVGISNLVEFIEGGGTRDRFLMFVFLLSLAGLTGTLSYHFAQHAIAIHRGSLDGSSAKQGWTIEACGSYSMVACLVFLSAAPGVSLWVSLLIVVLPPTALVAVRYPALNQERQARSAARKAAARPKVSIRNQRVTQKATRAQRRARARS